MKFLTLIAPLALVLAAVPALAAEREPVTLNDGVTGMAEILATTPDTVSVRFFRKGVAVETVLPVKRLDPISYYEIRRRHMESTPENHVRLAVFCAENGMLHQARFQMDNARALDPDIEKKIEARTDVMEAIATRLADAAKRHFDAGDFETARDLVHILATRFTETKAAARADAVLDQLDRRIAEREAAQVAARQKKLQDAKDAEARAAAERREAVVVNYEKRQTEARDKESWSLRQRNSNNAMHGHENAANIYQGLLADLATARKAAANDPDLDGMLAEIESECRQECADAYINAGNLQLPRSNFDRAETAGKQALEVNPGYARAKSFLESVDMAREQAEEFRNLQIQRERR